MIRIVVAEDHRLVREGICRLLEDAEDMKVVGQASNGADALKLAEMLHPDVLVLDISMPRMDGLEALAQVSALRPKPQVLMLSVHADVGMLQQALQAGALGYVLKEAAADELLAAIRAVARGSMYLGNGISQFPARALLAQRPQNALGRLSPRELEVVKKIVEGLSTREIAAILGSSVKTVEKQRRDAMRKLEVENVASLVRVSLELGLKAGKGSDRD